MISDRTRSVEVSLQNFKAFLNFRIQLKKLNIIVGPNNAGKSTILTAFRILEPAIRRASAKRAELVQGPNGHDFGHRVSLAGLSVADENIFHNYNDTDPAVVTFTLSNKNKLILFFGEPGSCVMIPETANGLACNTPKLFRRNFDCSIGFVPILGPVEHKEIRYEQEAARLALNSYGAARNFRNIWYHFPDMFNEFRSLVQSTWPGMDIEFPELEVVDGKPRLFMYCPEQRLPRELFWAGFGFQVWCQMLTYIVFSEKASIFLIDEPDIYLHSDLKRQLLSILREMDSDVLIATHSTEILSEAEFEEIVVVDKKKKRAARVKDASQLSTVFSALGSNLNPILTQISKTGKTVFLEGNDYQILGRLAVLAGYPDVGRRSKFAIIPVNGFNPQKVKHLVEGFQTALGFRPESACILDRDYRSDEECSAIENDLSTVCSISHILQRKEVENYLLVPSAIDVAATRRITEKIKRGGVDCKYSCNAAEILDEFSDDMKHYVSAQYSEMRRIFERSSEGAVHGSTLTEDELRRIDQQWDQRRFFMIPGKQAISRINSVLRESDGINVTPLGIISCLSRTDIPDELLELFSSLRKFVT